MQVKLYQHLFKVKILVMNVQPKSMEQGIYMKHLHKVFLTNVCYLSYDAV